MFEVTIVGAAPGLRLPEVLAGPGAHITVIGNVDNPLRHSRFVDRFIELDYVNLPDLAPSLLEQVELLESLRGWVIFTDDPTAQDIASSTLSTECKLRLLPVRQATALGMVGSKVGLELVQRAAGAAGPRTAIARTPADLAAACAEIGTPFLVKGDRGGAGTRVLKSSVEGTPAVPDEWFPVVVQEFVAGPVVSSEVLFRDGVLAGWTYARLLMPQSREFVPSTLRLYVDPPRRDFVDDLERIGHEAQLHGFFNATAVWSPERQQHLLFELDPRPNAWHSLAPSLGVDWRALMSAATPITVPAEQRVAPAGRLVHLYPRELADGFNHRTWGQIRPWVLALPGTWQTRPHRDRAVNAAERRVVLEAATHFVGLSIAMGLVSTWGRLPARVQAGLDSGAAGAARRVLRRISGPEAG